MFQNCNKFLKFTNTQFKFLKNRYDKIVLFLKEYGSKYLRVIFLFFLVSLIIIPFSWQIVVLFKLVGLTILLNLLFWVLCYVWKESFSFESGMLKVKDTLFLVLVLIVFLIIAKCYYIFIIALTKNWEGVTLLAFIFGLPLSASSSLATLFLGVPAGIFIALLQGFLVSFMWEVEPLSVFLFYFIIGVVASGSVRIGYTRLALIQSTVVSSFVGFLIVFSLFLLGDWEINLDFIFSLLSVWIAGLVAGIMTAGWSPLIEFFFGYTTDACLMELANLDHPALQDLMLKAPGTYHHSLIVGSLVEAAAKEIGANHLLARVAALYHDIGKIRKADYFVENQKNRINKHDKLAPSMSALILISHIKEGVEIAWRYRLGGPIINIMTQHHGTRRIHFFYDKAVEKYQHSGDTRPSQENFCYPGPRPQTREAGLVMLADTLEAAARSLENHNPSRIQGLVQSQINKVFAEGQLNECELTLKDLHKIAKSFNKILNGIFHQRIEYPGNVDKVKRKYGNTDTKSQQTRNGEFGENSGSDKIDLKRLGMSSKC